jgi:hypothetical protein
MSSSTRLRLSGVIIILSALFAVLIATDPATASAVFMGYVALILTAFLLSQVWKKP